MLPRAAPTLESMFGFESYDGGSVVVHALRLEVGDEAFFTLLAGWIGLNTGTSQTSDAFISLAQDLTGADLGEFFDSWLYADEPASRVPVGLTATRCTRARARDTRRIRLPRGTCGSLRATSRGCSRTA